MIRGVALALFALLSPLCARAANRVILPGEMPVVGKPVNNLAPFTLPVIPDLKALTFTKVTPLDAKAVAPTAAVQLQNAVGPEQQPVHAADGQDYVRGKSLFDGVKGEPDTAVVPVLDVDVAMQVLREGSHPRHDGTDGVLRTLSSHHPGLPLAPEQVFLVKDPAALAPYGIPSAAAGAARILSDGKREQKIVIVVAEKGVALDDFVEYAIHEAIHLKDDGILRLPHEKFVHHWFAEGYTQLRAHAMANASLKQLGRPERKNGAYSAEVALVEHFIAKYGEAPLKDLVENGSDAGLKKALGARWTGLLGLAHENEASTLRQRDYFLKLAGVVVEHPTFGKDSFREAARKLHGDSLSN